MGKIGTQNTVSYCQKYTLTDREITKGYLESSNVLVLVLGGTVRNVKN